MIVLTSSVNIGKLTFEINRLSSVEYIMISLFYQNMESIFELTSVLCCLSFY